MKPIIALAVIATLASCAHTAQKADPRTRSVEAGSTVILDNFGFWNKDCQSRSFTRKINIKPANGTISYRDATYSIPERVGIGSSSGCVGRSVDSKEVIYTPNDGFTGVDVVGLVIGNQSGSRAFTYTITVN